MYDIPQKNCIMMQKMNHPTLQPPKDIYSSHQQCNNNLNKFGLFFIIVQIFKKIKTKNIKYNHIVKGAIMVFKKSF